MILIKGREIRKKQIKGGKRESKKILSFKRSLSKAIISSIFQENFVPTLRDEKIYKKEKRNHSFHLSLIEYDKMAERLSSNYSTISIK